MPPKHVLIHHWHQWRLELEERTVHLSEEAEALCLNFRKQTTGITNSKQSAFPQSICYASSISRHIAITLLLISSLYAVHSLVPQCISSLHAIHSMTSFPCFATCPHSCKCFAVLVSPLHAIRSLVLRCISSLSFIVSLCPPRVHILANVPLHLSPHSMPFNDIDWFIHRMLLFLWI